MIRYSMIPIQQVFSELVGTRGIKDVTVDGTVYQLKANSARYKLFKRKGLVCRRCGRRANAACIEASEPGTRPHVNFYLIRPGEKDLLFTKDHIIPKCKGGKNTQANYQPMCTRCNSKKGGELEEVGH